MAISNPLVSIFGTGFMLGAGFIVAIGSQNAFVLQQGLQRRHIAAVVAVCITGDVFLIAAGTFGVGPLITQWPLVTPLVTVGGALFLTAYGLRAARRAVSLFHPALLPNASAAHSVKMAVATAAAFTFFNPHVYLDTVILLGTLASTYHGVDRLIFAGGAIVASIVWFITLGYGARVLQPLFATAIAWRVLDGVIAITMLVIAGRLWFSATASVLQLY